MPMETDAASSTGATSSVTAGSSGGWARKKAASAAGPALVKANASLRSTSGRGTVTVTTCWSETHRQKDSALAACRYTQGQ
jgi:hypothetical protein